MDTGAILTKKEVWVGGVGQGELGKLFWGMCPILTLHGRLLGNMGFSYRVKPKHISWEACSGGKRYEQLTSLWSMKPTEPRLWAAHLPVVRGPWSPQNQDPRVAKVESLLLTEPSLCVRLCKDFVCFLIFLLKVGPAQGKQIYQSLCSPLV